jgi:DNA-binding beta-propeller fold protein YncE
VSPSAQPAQIWALPYADGGVNFPAQPEDQQVGQTGHPGYNVALSADGSLGIIPLWLGKFDVVSIDSNGKLTIAQQLVTAGGNGTHSVAISADGTTAYIRNLLPPANIAVFKIASGPMVTDTGLRLNAEGLPASVVQLAQIQGNGFGYVGSEMIAVTPDNKKIYAVNPFAGPPDPNFLGLYGSGELQVFNTNSPNPIGTVPTGKNPVAVAIQPQ